MVFRSSLITVTANRTKPISVSETKIKKEIWICDEEGAPAERSGIILAFRVSDFARPVSILTDST